MMIRPQRDGDAGAIHAVHASSFPTDAEAKLVDHLRDAGRLAVSIVAEVDGAIVGHAAISPVSMARGDDASDNRQRATMSGRHGKLPGPGAGAGLGPIAVVEAHRRRGVGGELIRAALAACRDAGFGWVVVLGEPAYYARFGFRAAAAFGLSDEYGGGDAFAAVELTPGALPRGAGLVKYAPEFASLA